MSLIKALVGRIGSKIRPSRTDPVRNADCSEFEADNWQLSQFVLQKLVPVVGAHPFPLHELMLMSAAVCRFRPPQIYEWGTHIGKSARVFYECVAHFGIACEIHSVDLPDDAEHVEHPEGARGKLVRGLNGVHLHQGDGLTESLGLWRRLGRKEGVLFFVDGDHEYGSVQRELSAIVTEVPSAKILAHDTFFQSPQSGYNVGPHRAIEEVLSARSGSYRRVDSGLGLPGMTLLYRA